MNFSSKFINEITGFKMKNLDIVYQQISVKYNIINSNNNVKYILQNNNAFFCIKCQLLKNEKKYQCKLNQLIYYKRK